MRSLHLVGMMSLIVSTNSFARLTPKQIENGRYHTCLVSEEGALKCWGDNYYGQLGHENYEEIGSASGQMGYALQTTNLGTNVKVAEMCSGYGYSCALTTEGKVKCWGLNTAGVLGQGINTYNIGGKTGSMGDQLPYTNLGTDFKAATLSCGVYHACALNGNGQAKCWGQNDSGQLGAESAKSNIGAAAGEMGDVLGYVKESQKIKTISTGYSHSCAVLEDETIKCWGANNYGQLGIENTTAHGKEAGTMDQGLPRVILEPADVKYKIQQLTTGPNYSCVLYKVDTVQKIKCWGQNYQGVLGIGKGDSAIGGAANSMGQNLASVYLAMGTIAQIQAYNTHACARNTRGNVKCWGNNAAGILGLEHVQPRGLKPEDMGANLPYVDLGLPVRKLSHGVHAYHTCGMLINGLFKCWGEGVFGKLGYESSTNIGPAIGDMGEQLPYIQFE